MRNRNLSKLVNNKASHTYKHTHTHADRQPPQGQCSHQVEENGNFPRLASTTCKHFWRTQAPLDSPLPLSLPRGTHSIELIVKNNGQDIARVSFINNLLYIHCMCVFGRRRCRCRHRAATAVTALFICTALSGAAVTSLFHSRIPRSRHTQRVYVHHTGEHSNRGVSARTTTTIAPTRSDSSK